MGQNPDQERVALFCYPSNVYNPSMFVIYTLLFGFGGGGFFNYFGPGVVFWLVALACLMRGTALAREG